MTIPHEVIDAIMRQIRRVNALAIANSTKVRDFSMPINNNDKSWGGLTYMVGESPTEVARKNKSGRCNEPS